MAIRINPRKIDMEPDQQPKHRQLPSDLTAALHRYRKSREGLEQARDIYKAARDANDQAKKAIRAARARGRLSSST